MGNRPRGPRVRGPFEHYGRWQIAILNPLDAERPRVFRSYPTEQDARAAVAEWQRRLSTVDLTAECALDRYAEHLGQKGWRERSIGVTVSAVRQLMGAEMARFAQDISCAVLTKRIEARRLEVTKRGTTVSLAALSTELRQVKAWLRWLADSGLVRLPGGLDKVRIKRKRGEDSAQGKEQLTREEAVRFAEEAKRRARAGDEGGLAAYAVLMLGVRARELLDRTVRDLDGDWLWIRRAKTKRGNRRVQVPGDLLGLLRDQAEGRQPDALLFGEDEGTGRRRATSWLEKQVRRVCEAVKSTTVCPHGLRGTHATLAEGAGVSPVAVAASLGHASPVVTGAHYTLPDARQAAQQDRLLQVVGQ